MRRRGSIRPGKGNAMLGFVVGIVFCLVGLTMVIPTFGLFGVFWTFIAVAITVTNGRNAFTDKGVPTTIIEYEDVEGENTSQEGMGGYSKFDSAEDIRQRIEAAQKLYESGAITYDEYNKKKEELLRRL